MISIPQTFSQEQLSFKFGERTCGVPQEMAELAMTVMRLPFSDVAGN
jgi:hypothetical protein